MNGKPCCSSVLPLCKFPITLSSVFDLLLTHLPSVIDEVLKFFERQLYNTKVTVAPAAQNGSVGKPKKA